LINIPVVAKELTGDAAFNRLTCASLARFLELELKIKQSQQGWHQHGSRPQINSLLVDDPTLIPCTRFSMMTSRFLRNHKVKSLGIEAKLSKIMLKKHTA